MPITEKIRLENPGRRPVASRLALAVLALASLPACNSVSSADVARVGHI